jgi:hypothetical protein
VFCYPHFGAIKKAQVLVGNASHKILDYRYLYLAKQ